ncbi:hypothetical protein [Amycolatopsis sp. NPDC051372]|uniref:hypothetical protein n=1 Tax=Amycolatopsis sp. NPDC051372 TaxID=3155669 RepID=UPI00342E282D
MSTRMVIRPDSTPLECEICGQTALHVARLVTEGGGEIGQTVVCTSCRHRRRVDNER